MNRHSNQTLKIADDLVSNYSKRGRGTLSISMSDLPTYEQQDLAAHMLCDDPMRASEALGEDNPFFERAMKPSLIRAMKASCQENNESCLEFYKMGIVNYLWNAMDELLQERMNERNLDERFNRELYKEPEKENQWRPAC